MGDDAAALHYDVHDGDGPYVLLVHGFLSSRAQWTPNIAALSTIARPVVVELLGHARSPSPDDPAAYTPDGYVRAFERIREDLRAERWFICGQSLGAALTLRYTLEHPARAIAQVFTNSTSALAEDGWGAQIRPAMEAQGARLEEQGRGVIDAHPLNPARSKRLATELRAEFEHDVAMHSPHGLAMTGLHTIPTSSVRGRIGENTVPTMLVVGERESRFEPHRAFAEREMPLLTVVGLEGGHAVNIDAAPAFDAAVVEFLRGHRPA